MILEPLYYSSFVFATLVYGVIGINFVDHFLNQGAPAEHKSAETTIGHESGHIVIKCYHKFNINFQGSHSSDSPPTNNKLSNNSNMHMQAMFASSTPKDNEAWFFDTGPLIISVKMLILSSMFSHTQELIK